MYNNENYGNGLGPTEEKKEQNIPNVDAEGGEVKAESGAAYTEGSTGFSENTESASYNKQENRENTAGSAYGTYGQWSGCLLYTSFRSTGAHLPSYCQNPA